ncbi:medium-chain acyl-CoA ligase ACSF2, mitochondrial-like [Panulirus ornatus]|uniref:medium-chain acyl-CoA ligase ACSF2, mitochondrial-like n=1 Tax=Panulirus ornatus TaxID=150431 RepID=UPI003A8AFEB7
MNINALRLASLRRLPATLHLASLRTLPATLQSQIRPESSTSLTWSYVSCPGKWPLLGMSVGQLTDRAEQMYGDREAIVSVYQDIRRTFSQVKEESERIAAGLIALRLQPGDRLGIWGPNSYEWYLTQLAAAKAGLILVNINPAYRPDELEYCLNKVSVKAIICHETFKTSDYYQMLCELAPELPSSPRGDLRSSRVPYLKQVIFCSKRDLSGTYKFEDLYEAGDSSHIKAVERLSTKMQFDDPCSIQFTSVGTLNPF